MSGNQTHENRKPHYHSPVNRGLYCLGLVTSVLAVGTLGLHWIEKFSFVDAFYFTSMIATGQGPAPNVTPATIAGKLFTCLIAFISVGSMVASFGFLFGPFFGKLLHLGKLKMEEELEYLKKKGK